MPPIDPLKLHLYRQLQEKVKQHGLEALSPLEIQEIQEIEAALGENLDAELERYNNERLLGFCLAGAGILFLGQPIIAVPLMLAGAYFVTGFKPDPRQKLEVEEKENGDTAD